MSINITGAGVSSGSGLALHPISLISPKSGGYKISYSGRVQPGADCRLGCPMRQMPWMFQRAAIITICSMRQIFINSWSGSGTGMGGVHVVRAQLLVDQNRAVVAGSNTVEFDCPIKPLVCRPRLTQPNLGLNQNELVGLNYAADDNHGRGGRFLNIPAIDGCYYFLNGDNGKFETDNSKRGLVCTS